MITNPKKSKRVVVSSQWKVTYEPECMILLDAFDYYGCLRRIKQSLDEDALHNLTLQKAAKVACLEPTYFSTFFQKKSGYQFRYLAYLLAN
jgi:hypothetical protein